MEIIKREILYTCKMIWNGKELEIVCNNKGELKSMPGIVTSAMWNEIKTQVKREFKRLRKRS